MKMQFNIKSTDLLVLSFSFIIPATYAFLCQLYFHSVLLVLASIISAVYWIKPTYSWRRQLDLIFAKISFVVFVYNGIIYVKTPFYMITGYSGLIVLIYCFYLSNKLANNNNKDWYKFHLLFHFIMMYEQIIILHSILSKNT